MKQFSVAGYLIVVFAISVVVSGCSNNRKPVKPELAVVNTSAEEAVAIKGAPEWVNKGSNVLIAKERRLFHGVAATVPMGDLALQKAVADDRARAEVSRILISFLDAISSEYSASLKDGANVANKTVVNDQAVSRQLEDASRAILSYTRIIGSWRDPVSNNIWSIAELDMKQVKTAMAGLMSLDADLKKFTETKSEYIFDNIVRERNRLSFVAE
jgi:hypothetical protein